MAALIIELETNMYKQTDIVHVNDQKVLTQITSKDVFVKYFVPRSNKVHIKQKISMPYIFTLPHPMQGDVMLVKHEKLCSQSLGHFITIYV